MNKRTTTRKKTAITPAKAKRYLISLFFALILGGIFVVQEQPKETRPPQAGKPAELYANQTQDDLTYTFTSAINNAKESILLVVYSLTDPDVIASLKQKSEEGIPIKVICDAKASPYIDSKLGSKIETTRRFGPGLMHQKILVVDKKQTWIGSANMTPESLKMHGNLVAAIDSPLLAEEVIAKAHTLNVEGQGSPFPHFDLTIGEQSLELWFLPDNKDAMARLKKLIQTAEKTIRIAMFTWTRHDLAQEVIAAKKRGLMLEWSSTITLERAPAPKLQPY